VTSVTASVAQSRIAWPAQGGGTRRADSPIAAPTAWAPSAVASSSHGAVACAP
jgi:hypothetical protein